MKFEFHGHFGSVLAFLELLDRGKACKIQNTLKFWCKYEILSIWVFSSFFVLKTENFQISPRYPNLCIFFNFWGGIGIPNCPKTQK